MARVIGVMSLKGGVGKTTVTASLGDALSSLGKRVLLVDANLSNPNLGLHFNLVDPEKSLHHVMERKIKPSEAIYDVGGMHVMPSSLFYRLHDASPLKLKDRLSYLSRSYDVIIIDSAPSLNEETLGAILASDEILVVSTPDHPTLSNTMKSVRFLKKRGIPISGVVLNKVYNKGFELDLREIEGVVDVPVMAVIPHDVKVLKALSEFSTLTKFYPKFKGSDEMMRLAAALVGEKYNPPKFKKLWNWASPERQEINRQIFYESVFE